MKIQSENSMFRKKLSVNISGQYLDLHKPLVMGVLNVTPDSFYDGGKYSNKEQVINRARNILSEGGKIIDIGGVSTRPGSKLATEDEEIRRILPVAELIRKEFPKSIISIDTFRSAVVEEVVSSIGPVIVNDISGGDFDEKMYAVIAKHKLIYIIMHIQGTPENMQQNPGYNDITVDIIKHFSQRLDRLRMYGINDVILDPGFGFGKTIEHNYELLRRLDDLKILELPIMVGISRKSMIYKLLNTIPENALHGTGILHGLALERGANILRVHDVKEAVDTISLMDMFNSAGK